MKTLKIVTIFTFLLFTVKTNATDGKKTNNIEEGPYYYSVTLEGTYEAIYNRLKSALTTVEFGIVSEMKMHETLNKKFNTNIPTYVVLGICNPSHAKKALTYEENIGLMLPCKGLIRWVEEGKYVVSLQNPEKTLEVVENPKMDEIGKAVSESFKKALKAM